MTHELKWTTEFPTKPGFYWIRNCVRKWSKSSTAAHPTIVELHHADRYGFIVHYLGQGMKDELDSIISAEWYGPIDPPE